VDSNKICAHGLVSNRTKRTTTCGPSLLHSRDDQRQVLLPGTKRRLAVYQNTSSSIMAVSWVISQWPPCSTSTIGCGLVRWRHHPMMVTVAPARLLGAGSMWSQRKAAAEYNRTCAPGQRLLIVSASSGLNPGVTMMILFATGILGSVNCCMMPTT
jgi:hypothetical protein